MTLVIVYSNEKKVTKDIYMFQIEELLHISCNTKGLVIRFMEKNDTSGNSSDIEIDMEIKEAMKHADDMVRAFCHNQDIYEIRVSE